MVSGDIMGGIGNTLFQAAAIYGYSLRHNMDYLIPKVNQNPHLGQPSTIFPYLKYSDHIPEMPIYIEPSFEYNEIPYKADIYLRGYYQSYLYHYGFKKEILELFNIPFQLKEGTVFLHFRLGDYKTLGQFHQIISDDYIRKSVAYFSDKGYKRFMVFSDEIHEAKQRISSLKLPYIEFEYSEGKTELEDLSLMASCEGGIMSASSFSWWGAYVGQNEDRIILYPKRWFGESLSHHDTKDLCPKTWLPV